MKNVFTPLAKSLFALVFILLFLGIAAQALPKPWNNIIYYSLMSIIFLAILFLTIRPLILLPQNRKAVGELRMKAKLPIAPIFWKYCSLGVYTLNSWGSLNIILKYPNDFSVAAITSLCFWPLMVFFVVVDVSQKVEIRERGICKGADMTLWDEIDWYSWTEDESKLLFLKLKTPRLLNNNYAWGIREEDKEEVNRVLQQRIHFYSNEGWAAIERDRKLQE